MTFAALAREFLEDIEGRRQELVEDLKTRVPTEADDRRLQAFEAVLGVADGRKSWLEEVERALEAAGDDEDAVDAAVEALLDRPRSR